MPNSPHNIALEIVEAYKERNLNEADTRHQIIDEILHGVLSWPKELTKCESYIKPGFADYRLKKANNDDLFFWKQKRKMFISTFQLVLMETLYQSIFL